jgi:hypothetical protein
MPLGVPINFQQYTGKASTYITFFNYLEQGEQFSDDVETGIGYYIQIDIWSKDDYTDIVNSVCTAMQNSGFMRISGADLYESDTGYYHKALRYFYLKEV